MCFAIKLSKTKIHNWMCVRAYVCVRVYMVCEQGNWTGVKMNEEIKSVLIFCVCWQVNFSLSFAEI